MSRAFEINQRSGEFFSNHIFENNFDGSGNITLDYT